MDLRGTRIRGGLVVSAWVESGHPEPLRVRMTQLRVPSSDDTVVVVSTVDEACTELRVWLERLLASS
jgi:hypothetical protein